MDMRADCQKTQTSQSKRPLKIGLMMPTWTGFINENSIRWKDILAMACQAEAIGFDSLWVIDVLTSRIGAEVSESWECWSLLAALAARTSRIALGTLVTCTSFRNPALLANFAVTVDEISGGRFTLGLGVGGVKSSYDAFGFPWENRFGRFEEALAIIHRLLRTGSIDFSGKYFRLQECKLTIRGPQLNAIPLLIGTATPPGPRLLRAVTRYADLWNGGLDKENFTPEALPASQKVLDEACQAIHRPPETLARTVSIETVLPGYQSTSGPYEYTTGTLAGPPEQLAATFREFAQQGISHVQIGLTPGTLEGLEKFAPVLEILDKG